MSLAEDPTYVLIAEDDDDDYFIFKMAVDDLSLKIKLSRAENGDILMKILEEIETDILFLDLMMPCRDGKQCLTEIRANKKYDSLPIIVYSALGDLQNIEFCYRNGSNLYAIKAVSVEELKLVLKKIFTIDWKKMLYYPPLSQFVLNHQ